MIRNWCVMSMDQCVMIWTKKPWIWSTKSWLWTNVSWLGIKVSWLRTNVFTNLPWSVSGCLSVSSREAMLWWALFYSDIESDVTITIYHWSAHCWFVSKCTSCDQLIVICVTMCSTERTLSNDTGQLSMGQLTKLKGVMSHVGSLRLLHQLPNQVKSLALARLFSLSNWVGISYLADQSEAAFQRQDLNGPRGQ